MDYTSKMAEIDAMEKQTNRLEWLKSLLVVLIALANLFLTWHVTTDNQRLRAENSKLAVVVKMQRMLLNLPVRKPKMPHLFF